MTSHANPDAASLPTMHSQCLEHVRTVLDTVNTVQYLVMSMAELGRTFTADNVKCVRSEDTGRGRVAEAGYLWYDTPHARRGDVVLHEDKLLTAAEIERSLRHELIHAYDDVRGYVDPSNCYHQACSEVRAARLSGDCFLNQEVRRGNLDFFQSGRKCVERRATLAVEQNPLCRGFGARAVDSVFPKCFADFEPFVAPIYRMGSWEPEQA